MTLGEVATPHSEPIPGQLMAAQAGAAVGRGQGAPSLTRSTFANSSRGLLKGR